ncbi:MAG: BA14K family protein [Alphaproteobacteria bacterium]|nr:BA14K family protein [Alphaproteobacteria bacterium]
MTSKATLILSAAFSAGAVVLVLSAAAGAAPLAPLAQSAAQSTAKAVGLPVVEVAKRRVGVKRIRPRTLRSARIVRRRLSPRHRYTRRRALTRGIGIGIGIGIVAIIAKHAAHSEFQAAMRRCARDYRSFDWETGTYITYSGDVRLCPYLRPYL